MQTRRIYLRYSFLSVICVLGLTCNFSTASHLSSCFILKDQGWLVVGIARRAGFGLALDYDQRAAVIQTEGEKTEMQQRTWMTTI